MRVFLYNPSLHAAEWFYLEDAKCRQNFEKKVHKVIGLSLQGYLVQSYEGRLLEDGSHEAFIYEPSELVSLGWIFRYGQPLREAAVKTVMRGQELFFVRRITNSECELIKELYLPYMSLYQHIILCDGTELQYLPALQRAIDYDGRIWKPRRCKDISIKSSDIVGWSPCNSGGDALWYNTKALFVC